MARVRVALASLSVVTLAAGCGRDLELPGPPPSTPPPPATEPAPEFLGPLSGIFEISYGVPFLPLAEAPIADVTSLTLLEVPYGDGSRLAGFLLAADGMDFIAGFRQGSETVLVDAKGTFMAPATIAPGGDAFVFDTPDAGPCPSSPPQRLRARRTCGFEPSISGIYEGELHDGSCDGPVSPTYFAVGIRNGFMIVLGPPRNPDDVGQGYGGVYDWTTGDALLGGDDVSGLASLTEADGFLRLDVRFLEGCPEGGCCQCAEGVACYRSVFDDVVGLCDSNEGCTGRLALARRSGYQPDDCQPPTNRQRFGLAAAARSTDRSYIDVAIYDGAEATLATHDRVEAVLVSRPSGVPIPSERGLLTSAGLPGLDPGTPVLRFRVPDGLADAEFELFAGPWELWQGASGVALAACVWLG